MILDFRVIDRHSGLVTRSATLDEVLGWLEINGLPDSVLTDPKPRGDLTRAWAFSKPVYVGGCLIDTDTGPGSNMLGMPLG